MQIQPTGYWTFFCNPARWEIDKFLSQNFEYDHYSITKWQSDWFKPGQLGIVRVGVDARKNSQLGGRQRLKPGVYSIVEVLSLPRMRGLENDSYWAKMMPDPESLVVDIRYLKNMLAQPIFLEDLKQSHGITDKYLLNGFQASTMPLDPKTFHKLVELMDADEDLIYGNIESEPIDNINQIRELESKYEFATPEVKETISRRIERGKIANAFKRAAGYKCMVCESLGLNPIAFYKKNNEPYVEVHHVIPVANLHVGTLGPSNLITVCANHHRQLHYGNVGLVDNNPSEFVFRIDGNIVRVCKLSI
jgi:hypothetical protein